VNVSLSPPSPCPELSFCACCSPGSADLTMKRMRCSGALAHQDPQLETHGKGYQEKQMTIKGGGDRTRMQILSVSSSFCQCATSCTTSSDFFFFGGRLSFGMLLRPHHIARCPKAVRPHDGSSPLTRPLYFQERGTRRGSHDHASPAAAGVLVPAVHVHLIVRTLRLRAAAAGIAGHVFVVFPDLAHDVEEGVVDVDARLGRRLDELAAEGSGECSALCEDE